jgi:acetylornithine deacetylase/succinyl-diaminopimelate desuccinylase-like protein
VSDRKEQDETTDLLQQLIQNACVNDGRVESGGEIRSVDLLQQYLGTAGLDVERYEPRPGRASLVARIEGSDPNAPSLLLMGHTDVVPVNVDGWTREPFSGDVVDGFVWGRGAVDMLNITASQAVAFRNLAQSGFRPKGTLIYLAVADEEALGTWGAKHLVEHERDAVYADYVLTESGGYQMPTPEGMRLPVLTAEKGTFWSKLRIGGTPGHGSQPYRTDNAVVTAAEVVRRIQSYRPQTQIQDVWRQFVEGMHYPAEIRDAFLDPDGLHEALAELPLGMSRLVHACTHTTFSPNVMHGGTKTNVIPDSVELEVDIRTLPGQTGDEVRAMLAEALGDLADRVELESNDDPSTESPIDTPLWDSLARVSGRLVEGSALVPFLMVGGTDNRFFRRAGSVGYGFALFSRRLSFEDYATMFHGNDERVDVESLGLSEQLWEAVARDLLESAD